MEKGKGIQPGCMVILTKAINPANVGKIGIAIEQFKHTNHVGMLWTVQFREPLATTYQLVSANESKLMGPNGSHNIIQHPETWMRRIDGDPDDHFGEEDTMKPRKTVGELMHEYQTGFSKVPA